MHKIDPVAIVLQQSGCVHGTTWPSIFHDIWHVSRCQNLFSRPQIISSPYLVIFMIMWWNYGNIPINEGIASVWICYGYNSVSNIHNMDCHMAHFWHMTVCQKCLFTFAEISASAEVSMLITSQPWHVIPLGIITTEVYRFNQTMRSALLTQCQMVLVEDADKDSDNYKQGPVYPTQMVTWWWWWWWTTLWQDTLVL